MTGEQFVQNAAERVDVGGGLGGVPHGAFGGEVGGAADDLAGGGQRAGDGVGEAGDPEVGEFHVPVDREHDVGRLDVPVDHPVPVGGGQSGGHLGRDPGRLTRGQHAVHGTLLGEVPAVDEFHHQVGPAVMGAEVVHPHHVGVAETARGLRLHPEPLEGCGVVAVQDLHRDGAVENVVGGPPHLAHRAAPERFLQLIAVLQQHPCPHPTSTTLDHCDAASHGPSRREPQGAHVTGADDTPRPRRSTPTAHGGAEVSLPRRVPQACALPHRARPNTSPRPVSSGAARALSCRNDPAGRLTL